MKPFYLDVSVAREERSGIRTTGVPQDQTGGSNQLEPPEPVDYTTDTLKVEAGYAQNPFFASLSYFYSRFDNDNRSLNFINPLSANTLNAPLSDVLTLPTDNIYSVDLRWKALDFLHAPISPIKPTSCSLH